MPGLRLLGRGFFFKAGDAVWRDGESHATENIGASVCHAMNIEVKAAATKKSASPKAR